MFQQVFGDARQARQIKWDISEDRHVFLSFAWGMDVLSSDGGSFEAELKSQF